MSETVPFSRRFGFAGNRPLVHDAAPDAFRLSVFGLIEDIFPPASTHKNFIQRYAGVSPPSGVMLDTLVARWLILNCAWFRVFEMAEAAYSNLGDYALVTPHAFEMGINVSCNSNDLGWVMREGIFQVRGTDAEEVALNEVIDTLQAAGKQTSAMELMKARDDLSRIPNPDITGALQHAGAALECLARDISGRDETFGTIINRRPDLFPGPYKKVAEGIWGAVSNNARHLDEGKEPTFEDALLLIGLIAPMAAYLIASAT